VFSAVLYLYEAVSMRFTNEGDAITYLFRSMRKLGNGQRPPDEISRDTAPTRDLIQMEHLLDTTREYVVITGSKGKGSTAAILAKLLQHLGHRVGMITSPHMIDWRERIRANGQMIPEADFVRIVSDLAPSIDKIEEGLVGQQYFSPQGIFLAVALRWWDEIGINAAVCEVGRGGRFDDISLVPNRLSLFTPIMLEHIHQLGPFVERIAWHKAGIIKPGSYAYSVPQAPAVLDVLQEEADAHGAEFAWIAPNDMGQYVQTTPQGIRMTLGRYGELTLSLFGRYQVENATLAVQGAGNMHARLSGIPHGSPEYVAAIRAGLGDVVWPGRLQKLAEKPQIVVDGATTVVAAQAMLDSLRGAITPPLVAIVATPHDRDYAGVFGVFGKAADHLIVTANNVSPNVKFPPPDIALAVARAVKPDAEYAPDLTAALALARDKAGADGTILIGAALPVVAEALQLWGLRYERI
jgi:dihydrofolate synthase/folylpolyglutamate synthase